MTNRLKPQNARIPWIASFEFPSHADARAFAALVEEKFGDKAIVRKKNVVFNQGAFANWRTTKALREALRGRSFTHEMLGEALADAGYSGPRSATATWIGRGIAERVLVRLERGVYEFAPLPTGAVATPDMGLSCQPEPLQCEAR